MEFWRLWGSVSLLLRGAKLLVPLSTRNGGGEKAFSPLKSQSDRFFAPIGGDDQYFCTIK